MRKFLAMAMIALATWTAHAQVGTPQPFKIAKFVANLPQPSNAKYEYWAAYDGVSASDCSTGGGSNPVMCWSNGTSWIATSSSGGSTNTVASAETVAYSATPTFSTTTNASRIVLTGSVSSFTLGAGADGQSKTLCFKQGASSYTVAAPANVHGFFTIGTVNADWNCQSYVYDLIDSIWLATTTGVINI